MAKITLKELALTLENLQRQMAEISQRMEGLEKLRAIDHVPAAHASNGHASNGVAIAAPVRTPEAPPAITEDELIAISAAIGAYLGVRAHIRQIRLVSSNAWAQQGRVSIQASHMLQG